MITSIYVTKKLSALKTDPKVRTSKHADVRLVRGCSFGGGCDFFRNRLNECFGDRAEAFLQFG